MNNAADLIARALADIATSADLPRLMRAHSLAGQEGRAYRRAEIPGYRCPRRNAAAPVRRSTRPRSGCKWSLTQGAAPSLSHVQADRELTAGRIDVTLPGRGEERGGLHPVTQARLRIEKLFASRRL